MYTHVCRLSIGKSFQRCSSNFTAAKYLLYNECTVQDGGAFKLIKRRIHAPNIPTESAKDVTHNATTLHESSASISFPSVDGIESSESADVPATPMDGYGKSFFRDGCFYVGNFKDGMWHGKGALVFGRGKTFEGKFKENKVVRGTGKYVFENGDMFHGNFVNGKMHGKGVLHAPDGTTYESRWLGGYMYGACTVRYSSGEVFQGVHSTTPPTTGSAWHVNSSGSLYDGEWSDGLYHGRGTLYRRDGSLMKGRWVAGQLQGRGVKVDCYGVTATGVWRNGEFERDVADYQSKAISDVVGSDATKNSRENTESATMTADTPTIRYFDGSKYVGDMKDNLRHGFGIFTFSDGSVYEGQFNNNIIQGYGTHTNSRSGVVYRGQFERGVKHGPGELIFPTGEVFRGEFRHNKVHSGEGSYVYHYGSTYTGAYKDGMRHGPGVLREKNGSVLECNFVNNRPHGSGVFTSAEGEKKYELWEMGRLVKQTPIRDKTSAAVRSSAIATKSTNSKESKHSTAVTIHFEDDSVYKGECLKGVPHGEGRIKYLDGSEYVGSFRHARKHGFGRQRYTQFQCLYEGSWEHGRRHGTGTLHFYNTDEIFAGEFRQGKVHSGQGVYYTRDSHRYEGVFAFGYLIKGRVDYEDGSVYEGELRDNLHHGQGKLTDTDGVVVHNGQWEEGDPII